MKLRDPQTRSTLAAEYVLGTLRGRALRRFESMMRSDPLLRAEIEIWERYLYPLLDQLPVEAPPDRVWDAIRRELDGPTRAPRPRLLERVGFWQAGTALAAAASLVLAVLVFAPQPTVPPATVAVSPAAPPVAVLADGDARAAWLVRVLDNPVRAQVRSLRPQPAAADTSFELWVVKDATASPRSLGLIPGDGATTLAVPQDVAAFLPRAAALAVSLEPRGGSRTGTPTGPVLYQGALLPPSD